MGSHYAECAWKNAQCQEVENQVTTAWVVHDYTEPINTEQFLNIVQLLWEYAAKSAATPEITTNPWYVAHLKQRETAPGSWLSPEAAKQAANTTAEKFTLWLSTTLARMAIQSFSTSSPVYFLAEVR